MRPWTRWLEHPIVVCLLLANFVFLTLAGARTMGLLESLELNIFDWHLRTQSPAPVDDRILIIGETEADLQRFGHPLPDDTLAGLIERLNESQPRIIGIDKYRDIPVPPGSEHLDTVLTNNPNVVWIFLFGSKDKGHVAPPKILEGSGQIGFNDIVHDKDGVVRRGLLFLDDGQNVFYSFPLVAAMGYLSAEEIYAQADEANPEHIRLGEVTIVPFAANDGGYVRADDKGYQFLLDYRGMKHGDEKITSFHTRTLSDLMDGRIPPDEIRDRLVLFGGTAISLKDFKVTPFSREGAVSLRTFGVEMHAHVISQLLRMAKGESRPFSTLKDSQEYWWLWAWSLAGGLLGVWARTLMRFALYTPVGLAMIIAISHAAFLRLWWVPLVPPALGWVLSIGITAVYLSVKEKAQRGQLMLLFSRHVSRDVAEDIWDNREEFMQGGRPHPQRLTATVLFTDIRGFTTISEKMDPQALMDWLNTYMENMANIVNHNGGVINKYIGDAIMAIFGVPLPRRTEEEISRDAVNAVNCAVAMGGELERLNRQWVDMGMPDIGMRVGIHTGQLVAGSLGASDRLEYTVIGDTVNTASRLESFDKNVSADTPCRILISESTLGYLHDRFVTRRVDVVQLKGKEEGVAIHEVLGYREAAAETETDNSRLTQGVME